MIKRLILLWVSRLIFFVFSYTFGSFLFEVWLFFCSSGLDKRSNSRKSLNHVSQDVPHYVKDIYTQCKWSHYSTQTCWQYTSNKIQKLKTKNFKVIKMLLITLGIWWKIAATWLLVCCQIVVWLYWVNFEISINYYKFWAYMYCSFTKGIMS